MSPPTRAPPGSSTTPSSSPAPTRWKTRSSTRSLVDRRFDVEDHWSCLNSGNSDRVEHRHDQRLSAAPAEHVLQQDERAVPREIVRERVVEDAVEAQVPCFGV